MNKERLFGSQGSPVFYAGAAAFQRRLGGVVAIEFNGAVHELQAAEWIRVTAYMSADGGHTKSLREATRLHMGGK